MITDVGGSDLAAGVGECAMLENMKFKSSNGSGSLAAAYLIFSVGFVGATLFAGLSFRQHPEVPLLVLAAGGALGLVTILLRLRPELPSRTLWLFTRGRQSTVDVYTPRLIKSRPTSAFGTNHPPTADEIRDLKQNPLYWVPCRSRNGRTVL